MNLMNFFQNPFPTLRLSYDNLRKFVEIHIQRIAAQNENGKYDTMLTEITNAYTDYFGALTDEDTNLAIQQSATKTTTKIVEEFKQTISKKEGTIRGNWGKDEPEYQEFFPYGLSEYSNATIGNVEPLMTRILTSSESHVTVLGQPFVDLFKDIKARFVAARAKQLKKIGEVKDNKNTSAATRDSMEAQLYKNLLTLALEFMGNTEAGMSFYDQSFLKSSAVKTDGEKTTEPVNQ